MKSFVLFLFLFCSVRGMTQGVISSPELTILYRAYDNILMFGAGKKTKSLVLESEELAISKLTDSTYLVKVNTTKRTARINIRKKFTKKIVESVDFRILLLPSPVVYWGDYEEGSQITLERNSFSASFAEHELMGNKEFKIQVYEINSEFMELPVKGSGSVIKEEAITELKKAKALNGGKPILINVMLQVKGPDGILRKKSAQFTF